MRYTTGWGRVGGYANLRETQSGVQQEVGNHLPERDPSPQVIYVPNGNPSYYPPDINPAYSPYGSNNWDNASNHSNLYPIETWETPPYYEPPRTKYQEDMPQYAVPVNVVQFDTRKNASLPSVPSNINPPNAPIPDSENRDSISPQVIVIPCNRDLSDENNAVLNTSKNAPKVPVGPGKIQIRTRMNINEDGVSTWICYRCERRTAGDIYPVSVCSHCGLKAATVRVES